MAINLGGSWSAAFSRGNFAIFEQFGISFFGLGAVGGLAVALAAWADRGEFGTGLRVLSLSLLFGGASFVCGWVLGLLFGVPRTLSAGAVVSPGGMPAAAGQTAASGIAASRVNTNLEDISDWLTKTIVGVGLTQLFAVPQFVWKIANTLNAHGFAWDPYGPLLVLVLFLYFAPGGFWLGYVSTRTVVTRLFATFGGVGRIMAAIDPNNLRLVVGEGDIAPASDPAVRATDRILLSTPLFEIESIDELAAWGAAQARVKNYPAAVVALEDAVRMQPDNAAFKQALANLYTVTGRRDDARQVLRGEAAETEIAVLNALYEPQPAGFLKAIEIGERLAQRPDQVNNANLHVWLASAYGQQYGYEASQNATADELKTIRANALREIRAALRADPNTRGWLYSLWRPQAGSHEDDLKSLPQDDELTGLLGDGTVRTPEQQGEGPIP